MSSATRKKVLLGALVVVMVCVWWDGFHMMYPSSTSFAVVTATKPGKPTPSGSYSQIQYREPQVNPFYRPVQSRTSETQQRRTGVTTTPPLRTNHRLIGVLGRGKQSQAVVNSEKGNSVASIGDSLGGWQLIAINENHAVFKHDKQRDTLWLYQNAP